MQEITRGRMSGRGIAAAESTRHNHQSLDERKYHFGVWEIVQSNVQERDRCDGLSEAQTMHSYSALRQGLCNRLLAPPYRYCSAIPASCAIRLAIGLHLPDV
ncbi:hypothetical protein BAUCODRAFT_121032 [Baudoinia panamericana UAMH 10762]|uniref:Uncharacterized protein n=1 Tax=Baudoinia panamericana (strain UAMH 10762) TaxID=717646 RepID=M2MN80_BAUPA|nr:uncharacterized protein BAUCODRAFT_121032 [Baudoinia panamericana UAMH 10762]EMC98136.1 hypothetical protein BAUCODRAFT_121032 [Baudoinia panamericana UAMH 10762]